MKAITLSKLSDVQVSLAPDAIAQRDAAIASAQKITAVADNATQDECAERLRSLKQLIKLTEDSRQEVKAPVLDLGRKIDTFAREFIGKAEAEAQRLTKLLSAYQAEQQRIAAEAERKRQEELKRQEAERQRIEAEERARREAAERAAEEARLKAEAEFLAPTEAEAEAARKASEEAERRAKEEADRLAQAQREKAKAEADALALRTAAPVKSVKASGMSVGTVWKFEVTDIGQLVKARPDLCRIEPNTAAINAEIKRTKEIAGLRIWSETVANVR